jgi:hypothetical protein
MHRLVFALLTVLSLVAPPLAAAAAEDEIVAVVACDPYADLKKQIRWVGALVDQPTLDGFAESFIMMATQFKGLAGLDVNRPAGLVVTAAGDVPVVHAYVPVKDLAKLLDALVGVLGPVEEVDGVRRVSPPGGMPLDIVEKAGWAIVGPEGSAPAVADPTELFGGVVKPFTLGVEAFPSRMPEGMRRQLEAMLRQAAAAAAAQGQQVDPASLAGLLENLGQTEALLVGATIDMEGERVYAESQTRMTPGSPAAALIAAAANGVVTVATPHTSDGKPPALSLHLAMAVPEKLRQDAIAGLATIRAQDGSDTTTETAVTVLKEALTEMIAAGGYDAALSIDTSAVDDAGDQPVPAVTAGMKVKDGAALEARIKQVLAEAGALPGLTVTLDSGKVAGANLHTITLADVVGSDEDDTDDTLDLTLAVAPAYAYVLMGGDVPQRLAAVAAASGKPDPERKPLADVSLAVGPLLRYAASMARATDDAGADPDGLEAAAEVADAQASALVQLLVRPIERGMSLRLSADAGAVRTVAASVKPQAKAAGPAAPGVRPGPLVPALAP